MENTLYLFQYLTKPVQSLRVLINVRGVVKMCQNDNIHSKRTLVSECH